MQPEEPSLPDGSAAGAGTALRWPALAWALLHVPAVLWLYGPSLSRAVGGLHEGYRAPLWPSFAVEAAMLALLPFLLALPLSPWGRIYRWAAPALTGLFTVGLALDAQLYASVGFHVNGFFFRVLAQPAALRETGIPTSEVVGFAAKAAAWVAGEVLVGAWFLRRFAARRRVWAWAVAILVLGVAERFTIAALAFFGGPAAIAAGQVLPLQIPVRMDDFMSRVTGRPPLANPFKGAAAQTAARVPPGVPPAEVRFARKPDVILVLLESMRADYLDAQVMPRMLRRALAGGTIFERHYATAPTTYFAVFSALFGLEAHKLDAVAGAGRRPLLFGAFQANGYRTRLFASSSVEWMGLKESVFGDVQGDLENEFPGNVQGEARDAAALARAREWVGAQDDRPLFLFVFLVGTHFNYTYPPRSARFPTTWDGSGLIRLTQAPADQILNRARNSAYEVDWKVDEFLDWFGKRRGKTPLVIVTGDHGEEMREHGHVGHGSSIEDPQIHVPMVVLGDGVPRGRRDVATSHVDIVPTFFRLLGDEHPPALYSDGLSMFEVPEDRFVLATVGWEPRFAAIGKDLKVSFFGMDAGFGGVSITDPFDRPLPDAKERFAARAGSILKLFGREGRAATPAAAGLVR